MLTYNVLPLLLTLSGSPASATPSLLRRTSNVAKAKTLIDPLLYEDILHAANFSSTYSDAPCKHPPPGSEVYGFANNASTATQFTVFRVDARRQFILAFPGSIDIQDFLTDFDWTTVDYPPQLSDVDGKSRAPACEGCKVARGFYFAWESVRLSAEGLLTEAAREAPGYEVWIAGHSLGGALVSMAFAGLKARGFEIARAVSFGQPRTGNQAFADWHDGLSGVTETDAGSFMRVVHGYDAASVVPFRELGYQHHSTEYWITNPADLSSPSAASTYRCYGQEPVDCNANGTLLLTADHITYPGIDLVGCGL